MKKNETVADKVDNVITDMQFKPKTEETSSTPAAPKLLTGEEFNAMGAALARLHEIRNTKPEGSILTRDRKNDAAALQKEGTEIINQLAEQFITHGQEFLGAWMVLKSEYEPLVNGAIPFFRRLANSSAAQARAAQSKQPAK